MSALINAQPFSVSDKSLSEGLNCIESVIHVIRLTDGEISKIII